MRKVLVYICIFTLLFPYISMASVKRTVDFRVEEIIPIDEFSYKQETIEYVDIFDYRDVEVIESYVDNGKVNAEIIDNKIRLKLEDGEFSYKRDKVTKNYVEELKKLPLDDERNRTIIITPKKEVENISSVSGDFESAKIDTDGNIIIKVKKSALGIPGYDKRSIVTDEVEVKMDETNRKEKASSDVYAFEHAILEGTLPRIKYNSVFCNNEKLLSSDVNVNLYSNGFNVEFSNGMPKLNETKNEYTYPYFWIDRFSNGKFEPHYPNEVYNTPKVRFKGNGTLLPSSNKPEELIFIVDKDEAWSDYSGYELDGKKYVYVDTKTSKNPFSNKYMVLDSRSKVFKGQWFNTEKLTMTIEDKEIIYEPEGKLFSCGYFVPNTEGWGDMIDAKDWEIQDSFYNPYIDGYDTYVKHFQFFYGPMNKTTLGGYYTYPYSCVVEYDHYKPADLYSGNVVYTYKESQEKEGYYYNGWIKIKHIETKTVDDFPPQSPYNLKYNATAGIITWREAKDDYTPKEKMRYEVEYQENNIWKRIGNVTEDLMLSYSKDGNFRVRAVDEMGQYSPWTYSVKDLLEINGQIIPRNIKAGESLKIEAETISHDDIVSVQAIQEELGINEYLYKIDEDRSKFLELSFNAYGHVQAGNSFVIAKNSIYAYSDDEELHYRNYNNLAFADEGEKYLELDMPLINDVREIPIAKNFTVIIPNQNYLDTPTDFFRYDDDIYGLQIENKLYGYNPRLGKKELLIGVDNLIYKTRENGVSYCELKPKLSINSFKYNEENKPEYIEIWLDKEECKLPITMTMETKDNNMSTIKVYLGTKLKYSFLVPYKNIEQNIRGINYYNIRKFMQRFIMMGRGYTYPNSKKKNLDWADIGEEFRDMRGLKWLGCKYNEIDYQGDNFAAEYNNYPTTRDVNRLLFSDKALSIESIDKYNQLIKNSNLSIKSGNKDSVLGDKVMEVSTKFKSDLIYTPSTAKEGVYWITVIARTTSGNEARVLLPLNIGEAAEEEKKEESVEEELEENVPIIKSADIGRFHYEESKGKISELLECKTTQNISEGFISAGETLSLKLLTKNIDSLSINIEGNNTICAFDDLTKRFLYDEPLARGNVVEALSEIKEKYKFPVTIYPVKTNEDGSKVFEYKYVIPYKTKQTIHSWSTLRKLGQAGDAIDSSRILERISEPYKIVIEADGSLLKKISFDVFERWDNVLNRDLSKYLI